MWQSMEEKAILDSCEYCCEKEATIKGYFYGDRKSLICISCFKEVSEDIVVKIIQVLDERQQLHDVKSWHVSKSGIWVTLSNDIVISQNYIYHAWVKPTHINLEDMLSIESSKSSRNFEYWKNKIENNFSIKQSEELSITFESVPF